MTTRARIASGVVKEQFEGRVRKWTKEWVAAGNATKEQANRLRLLRWLQTGTVSPATAYAALILNGMCLPS